VGNTSALSTSTQATTQTNAIVIPLDTWVNPLTNGFPEQVVGYGKLVYAPALQESIMLGNYHGIGSEPDEGIMGYNFPANRWDVLSLGGDFHTENMPEGGHTSGMAAYDPNSNVFIYYGMNSGSNEPETPLHTWWFDPIGQVGRDKQPPSKPGRTPEGSATFDAADNMYVYFDGENGVGTYTYNPTTNVWQKMTPNGTPPPLSDGTDPAMTYDSASGLVYLFGGSGNDIYTYSVPSNTWALVTPTGTKPPARNSNTFAYDSTNNIFLTFGGYPSSTVGGTPLDDTWVYDPTANAWTQLSPSVSPPASAGDASYQYLTYDSDDNAFVLAWYGNNGYASGTWNYYGGQTWLFRYAGTGPNAGTALTNPQPTAGSINNHTNDWASEPVLSSNGSTLYSGRIEMGQPFDTSNAAWPHIYVSQLSASSTWNALGGSFNSLDSELSGDNESHAPSLTLVSSTPWVSWYKYQDPNLAIPPIYAKFWNGSS
jgi:hypothetical protein